MFDQVIAGIEAMSRSSSPSQITNSQTPTINEELEATLLPQRSDARENFVLQNCLPKDEKTENLDSDIIPQTALRPLSRRPLARALRDIGFAIFPLYFLVFAILTYRQDGKPSDEYMSVNLLAVAKYVSQNPTTESSAYAISLTRYRALQLSASCSLRSWVVASHALRQSCSSEARPWAPLRASWELGPCLGRRHYL